METRVYNCLIVGVILFLVILLVKKNELFSVTTPAPIQSLTPVQNLSKLLGNNHGVLEKLESGIESQLVKMKTYIANNNYLKRRISKEKFAYQNLIKQNNEMKKEILMRILALSKKRGIKNPQQIVDQLMTKNGLQ